MTELVTFNALRTRDQNQLACVTLNNPNNLHALTLDMVDAIGAQLARWQKDKSIVALWLEGSGDKAFCAGGDLHGVYKAMRAGPEAAREAAHYFEREYRMDHALHRFPHPVVAWGNGIVMGGGLGIFMSGDARVVTERSRLAMPEITIGLFADVGASHFLNRLPYPIARFIALTGANLNAADALHLGLATTFISQNEQRAVKKMLADQTWSDSKEDNNEIILDILESFAVDSEEFIPDAQLEPQRKVIESLFAEGDTAQVAERFLAHKTRDEWLQKAQQTLQKGSPLSAHLIDTQLREARNYSLEEAFRSELVLASNIVQFPEFAEGIRALLIDKDNKPNWTFKSVDEVDGKTLEKFFQAPWEKNPLADLV